METLLEKAKKIKTATILADNEELELTLAWLTDEITGKQLAQVLGKSSTTGNYLYAIAKRLKIAYKAGYLKIIKKV